MKLEITEHFNYPPEKVFKTFRDKLKEYVKYASNVTSAQLKERKELDEHRIKTRMVWKGSGQIPWIVRPILKPDMIKWKDEVIWDEKKCGWTWKIESFYFNEFIKCEGKWSVLKVGKEKSKIKLDGIFEVYIPHFPGVPDAIAQRAGKIIEGFIGRYLKPNLGEVAKAVKKFLEEEEV